MRIVRSGAERHRGTKTVVDRTLTADNIELAHRLRPKGRGAPDVFRLGVLGRKLNGTQHYYEVELLDEVAEIIKAVGAHLRLTDELKRT